MLADWSSRRNNFCGLLPLPTLFFQPCKSVGEGHYLYIFVAIFRIKDHLPSPARQSCPAGKHRLSVAQRCQYPRCIYIHIRYVGDIHGKHFNRRRSQGGSPLVLDQANAKQGPAQHQRIITTIPHGISHFMSIFKQIIKFTLILAVAGDHRHSNDKPASLSTTVPWVSAVRTCFSSCFKRRRSRSATPGSN